MKKIIFAAILIVATLSMAAQNDQLILKKNNGRKQKVIETSEKIKVVTKSGQRIKGRFQLADNQSIIIGTDTIQIEDIKKIRYKSTAGIISGSVVGITGTMGIVGGTALIVNTASQGAFAAIVGLIIGVPVIAVGTLVATTGVLVATVGKAHKPKKWEYQLIKAKD
jgi:Pyruvate/2-oxoacid:ferredoxin oxidoreductase gamma subunit